MFRKLANLTILAIDFNKPWWYLILKQKWLFLFVLTVISIMHIFWTLLPLIASTIFTAESFLLCLVIFALWAFLDFLYAYSREINAKFQLQCIHSIYQNAHQYLLLVDPKYHVHRATGAVISKIERGARGYEDLLDYITYEFTTLIIGLITVLVALAQVSSILTIALGLFFVIMFAIGYFFSEYIHKPFEYRFIRTDDNFKSTALENLAQIPLVRSTFATDFRFEKLAQHIKTNMYTEEQLWFSYFNIFAVVTFLYLCSVFILALFLLWRVKQTTIPVEAAIGLFLTYIQGSRPLISVIKVFRKYLRSLAAIRDLFAFIPTFGKQEFPVLTDSKVTVSKTGTVSIDAHAVYFDYAKAVLFNDHTFNLRCPVQQTNKLYGIIGPSGSGKTTLLSILGGQLKPLSGSILINNIDIYTVNDAVRRQLLAVQNQTSTNIQGTIRSNLLLGTPENGFYTDADLLSTLEKIGLLSVLSGNTGLATVLGEGGLNLSGGQRQRLNFAGLYLRARYYQPAVILIDEPTSSLDEISEAAITSMILELSQSAITLVIAHRLKTINQAVGLIDLSLLPLQKEIIAYSSDELARHSPYYQKLLEGTIKLDS